MRIIIPLLLIFWIGLVSVSVVIDLAFPVIKGAMSYGIAFTVIGGLVMWVGYEFDRKR